MARRLFGTAGLRGRLDDEITPDLAGRLARAYGEWIRSRRPGPGAVAVAHDTRRGGPALARAAAAGFAASGLEARLLGCLPTGPFSLAVARGGLAGGLLVTGSHLPPDRTGLILLAPDGAIAPYAVTDQVEALLAAGPSRPAPAAGLGRLEEVPAPWEPYFDEIARTVDAPALRARRFRLLLDPANGAACDPAPELFRRLGCDVEVLHGDPRPVPERPSEPRASTVVAAAHRVRQSRGDLGACFDVDADRVLFIDSDGTPLGEDAVGALFARQTLSPGDVCVAPVNSSGLIEEVCRRIGARLEYCAVGQPSIVQALRDLGAAYAYEESGKYWFARRFPWSDGLHSTARILEIMARTGKTPAELLADLPRFHQVRRRVPLDGSRRDDFMQTLEERLRTTLVEGRRRDVTIDGFKRIYEDGAWLLFRRSGTEPVVRVHADAPSRERAETLAASGEALLRECL